MVLVGNHCEAPKHERQVTEDEGRSSAKDLACAFVETEPKTGLNV
jgi:hypothetical protein